MKKRISFLLAVFMLLNLFGTFTAVNAEIDGVPEKNYEFVDTAYSPSLEMYVAVAKDFTKNTNGNPLPLKIYKSTDRVHWQEAFSRDAAYLSSNKLSHQAITWWEEAGLFAVSTGDNVFVSPDAVSWRAIKVSNDKQGAFRGNGFVATSGDTFASIGGRAVKFISAEKLYEPQVDHHMFDALTTTTSATGFSVSEPDENGVVTWIATSSSYIWLFTSDYDTSVANGNLLDVSKIQNNRIASATSVLDVVYVPKLSGWLVVNGSNVMLKVGTDRTVTEVALPTGTNITAAGDGGDYAFVGTADGKMYYADISDGELSSDTAWNEVKSGTGEMTDEVRSMCEIDDGYLAVTQSSIYIISDKDGQYKYYDVSYQGIEMVSGDEKIYVPETGSVSSTYKFAAFNYMRDEIEGTITSVFAEELPDGADFTDGVLTVTSNCKGGTAVINVSGALGTLAVYNIDIVTDSEMVFEGASGFVISDNETKTHNIMAYVIGTNGEKLDRTVIYSAVSLPEGVTFDEQTHILTISKGAQSGNIVIKAVSGLNDAVYAVKSFELAPSYPKELKIVSGETAITIPDKETGKYTYVAEVKNQAGELMNNVPLVWTVEGASDGISISNNGILSVSNTAYGGRVIISVSTEDETLTDILMVDLSFSDLRWAVEDAKELAKLNFTGLTQNITLPAEGSNGSKIKWKSSDESVISAAGVITRNNKKDTSAKLTATLSYYPDPEDTTNYVQYSETFNVTVKINDNIFKNGDAETGDTTGFSSEGVIESDADAHGGSYAIKSDGSAVRAAVSVPSSTLDAESAYYIVTYVKAPDAKSIKLKSDNSGELSSVAANNGYAKITGFIRTTKAVDDAVTISVDNGTAFLVDDLKGIDITDTYNTAVNAVSAAEYSKKQADYNTAKALVDAFYDCPERDALLTRLSKITIKSNVVTGGGGGGTGSSISTGASKAQTTTEPITVTDREQQVVYQNLKFKDMSGHWAVNEVEEMAAAGIVNGRDEGVFDPDASITRAEFSVLIVKTTGLEPADYENTFFDVISEDWYSGYVQAARNAGYLAGSNGLFSPNSNITREEIARIVVSAYAAKKKTAIKTGGALYFNDLNEISSWAYDYIVNAVDLGLMQGISEDSFAPKATATRAQAAVILKRLLDQLS